jgi:hypothetical protein
MMVQCNNCLGGETEHSRFLFPQMLCHVVWQLSTRLCGAIFTVTTVRTSELACSRSWLTVVLRLFEVYPFCSVFRLRLVIVWSVMRNSSDVKILQSALIECDMPNPFGQLLFSLITVLSQDCCCKFGFKLNWIIFKYCKGDEIVEDEIGRPNNVYGKIETIH